MNKYITEELKDKWMNYEFLGKPFKMMNGKTYMRAHSKVFEVTHFYCFDEDFMWFSRDDAGLANTNEVSV